MRETFPWGTHHLYDRVAGRSMQDLFDALAQERPDAQTVLDIGCGPGHLADAIADTHPRADVLGIDIDPAQIRIARKKRSGRARFDVGASDDLPLPDASRDWILATESFHHWSRPQASMHEIRRVLQPGGEAWIVEAAGDLTRDELRHWTWLHRVPGVHAIARAVARRHGYTTQRLEDGLLSMARSAGLHATTLRDKGLWRVVLRRQR